MKAQDIVFFVILIILLVLRRPKLAAISGMICLVISIPLFATWVFFTAERLTWYASGFFFLAIALFLFTKNRDDKE